MILAVKDFKTFHEQNMAMNKDHYTLASRVTKGKLVNYFQTKAARVHFNHTVIDDPYSPETPQKVVRNYNCLSQFPN